MYANMLSESVSYEIKLPNVTKRLYGSTALQNEPLTGISDKQYSKHILQKYYILSRISCEINYNYKSMINCVEVPLNSNQPKWLSHRQITHITNVTNHHVGFSCFEYDLYLPISALLNAFLYSERNSEMTENYDITSSLASKSRYTMLSFTSMGQWNTMCAAIAFHHPVDNGILSFVTGTLVSHLRHAQLEQEPVY